MIIRQVTESPADLSKRVIIRQVTESPADLSKRK